MPEVGAAGSAGADRRGAAVRIRDGVTYICVNCGSEVLGRKRFGEWVHLERNLHPVCLSGLTRARPMPSTCLRIEDEREEDL